MLAIYNICYIAGILYTMLYSRLLRWAQGVLYTIVYSVVYSVRARCYNMSLTSTASAIVMCGTGRSRSKASNSSVLKSGIPASRVAKGFSKSPCSTSSKVRQVVVVQVPSLGRLWRCTRRGWHRRSRGIRTCLRRVACQADGQARRGWCYIACIPCYIPCYIANTRLYSMQTAIYYGIKHFGYIACYIAKNRIYTMLYTMLYSIVYILKRVLGMLNAMLYSRF